MNFVLRDVEQAVKRYALPTFADGATTLMVLSRQVAQRSRNAFGLALGRDSAHRSVEARRTTCERQPRQQTHLPAYCARARPTPSGPSLLRSPGQSVPGDRCSFQGQLRTSERPSYAGSLGTRTPPTTQRVSRSRSNRSHSARRVVSARTSLSRSGRRSTALLSEGVRRRHHGGGSSSGSFSNTMGPIRWFVAQRTQMRRAHREHTRSVCPRHSSHSVSSTGSSSTSSSMTLCTLRPPIR